MDERNPICQSGEIFGERCQCEDETEVSWTVVWVPPYLRGTAEAARDTTGVEQTLKVCNSCAYFLTQEQERNPDKWILSIE